jgi:hypothetical protein
VGDALLFLNLLSSAAFTKKYGMDVAIKVYLHHHGLPVGI